MDADRPLVERTRGGDLRAFEELVDRHSEVVHRVAARIVGRDDADDITQDAFLRAFHRLPSYRGDAPFRAWLLQITHHAAINAVTRKREVADPGAVEERSEGSYAAGPRTPAESLEDRERRDRLETKLDGLRPEHRAVLVLRDLEGLTYDEIAAITETPLGTVKGRLHRARGELIDLPRTNTYDWDLPR
jgi:RNA polymerase sigma-70 factor, ECF subfamily